MSELLDAVSHAQAAVWAWLHAHQQDGGDDTSAALCAAVIALCDAAIFATEQPEPEPEPEPAPAPRYEQAPLLYIISTN